MSPRPPRRPRSPGGRAGRQPEPRVERRPAADHGLGGEQVEGRRAVRELLAAQRRAVRDVWISDSVEEDHLIAEIADLAAEAGVPIRSVLRARLEAEARTDAPQGVLAHARPVPEVDLAELCAGRPFLVVLDGVTDPRNLGALIRTADLAGATGAVLPRRRAAHLTPAAVKAAAGAVEHLPMAVVPGIPAALALLADRGVWTVGLDADGDRTVWELDLATEPVALVLGAEGTGLSRLVRARCDQVIAIPQSGHVASLNVAAAGAVAAFEVARRRRAASTQSD